jgi:hypothetical protein
MKKSKLPNLQEFREPVVGTLSEDDADRVNRVLVRKLDLLCECYGIKGRDQHKLLCLVLLSKVMKERGFQIIQRRRAGPPIYWTIQRHLSLYRFIMKQTKDGDNVKSAIRLAKSKFPGIGVPTLRAEYFRAKRFIEAAPLIVKAMIVSQSVRGKGPGSKFTQFLETGASVQTDYGKQSIGPSRIGRVTPKSRRGSR